MKDKVVIVTGGAKGIGAAIVRVLAQESAMPVILDRDEAAAKQLQTELQDQGAGSHVVIAKLAKAAKCREAVEQVLVKTGGLDALVNNAGVNDGVGLETGSPEKFVEPLERNLLHYYYLAHFALPALEQSRGTIINISSKTSVTGQGVTSSYV